MTDIRKSLEDLANVLESLENRPTPKPAILDRSLSGDKIHGGKITKFNSVGITDNATKNMVLVSDDGLFVDVVNVQTAKGDLEVEGTLTAKKIVVEGELTATKVHVDELVADVRNERTSPLEFKAEKGVAYGKGLIWPGGDYTKQFVLQSDPDRLFSSESVDLLKGKEYMIRGMTVLSETELGASVTESNLRKVGTLENLAVEGTFEIDSYVFWDSDLMRLGIGTESPNGAVSIKSLEHEFIIDSTDDRKFKLGTYTTSELQVVTDDTVRISVGATGGITLQDKVVVRGALGINVKNFQTDADITTANPVRFQGKKQEVGDSSPTDGTYALGDIVWSTIPVPGGYVGWICTREGTPGIWKPFGKIAD